MRLIHHHQLKIGHPEFLLELLHPVVAFQSLVHRYDSDNQR